MDTNAFLKVQVGLPYEVGTILPLQSDRMLIGRQWQDHIPEIAFNDSHISRNHAEITYENGSHILRDLPESKHGTEINGRPLMTGMSHVLKHNDMINLAKGAVVLCFCSQADDGQTRDISQVVDEEKVGAQDGAPIHEHINVDEARREVLLDSKEMRPRITGREFELILLLYRNRGRVVSHDDVIDWVWKNVEQRDTITRQDVNTIVHRLRKSLGQYGEHIINIPGYGYMLD